jgi:glutamate--cysteine ligase catalytic subunit
MYLDTLHLNQHERDAFERYLGLIRARSKGEQPLLEFANNQNERCGEGELLTTATWIRNFVRSHPAYKFDSVVSQEINYDLVVAIDEM